MTAVITGEYRRLAGTRLPRWAAPAALVCGVFFPGVLALVGPENTSPPMPGLATAQGVHIALGVTGLTLFIPAVLGTLALTAEFRHRTITTTFVTVPVRWKVLASKQVVHAGAGLAYGVVLAGAAGATLLTRALLTGEPLGVPPAELAALLLGLAVAASAYTVIGAGVGAIVHHPLLAGGIVLGYFYLVEPVLMLLPGVNLLYPYLPGGATAGLLGFTYLTDALSSQGGPSGPGLLAPVAAATVLFGYAAAASLVAVLLPLRRDIT